MSYQIKRPQIRFDVALLTELNKEYDSKRLVPKPASAARAAFIERGQVNAERIGKMFPVKGRRVLEIGCGEGDVAEYLARNFNCDVHAIDLQPHEIWKEHKHATFKPLDLSDADEATTKPEELLGTFDFIYSYYAWEHVLHPFGMLQRSQRLLRPGGKFYLSTNLFRGPRASHLYRDLHFPWPHLLFSEDVIYDYYVSQGLPPRYPSWVNRLSIADYLNYFPLAGFRLESISYSLAPIDEELYKRFEHWLARYPRFDLERDHLHAILTPAESGPLQPGVGSQTSGSPQPAARAADSRVSSAFSPGVAAAAPANTAKSSIPNDRLVALTVDVEAQAVRATGDPIDQLIFGRFDGKDYGISRMMELADAAGHKLTLYLDFCEFWQYGEAILDVAREVTRRGHDLQIHAHADLLPRSFWTDQRMSVPPALDRFPADAANVIVSATCELAVRATGRQPQAFRGGAFRFNPALLSALSKNGIQVSSNYYSGAKYWPSRRPHARPFRWENGVLELPVTTADVDGVFRYAIFENLGVDSRPTLEAFLSAARAVPGSLDVSSFVFHSWSLLRRDDAGKFSTPSDGNVQRFQAFLSNLTALGYRSATTEQILQQADNTATPMARVPYDVVFDATKAGSDVHVEETETRRGPPVAQPMPNVPTERSCIVCGASRSRFSDFFGRRAVRCEGCGSLERHRAFLQLCERGFSSSWSPAGKALLLISPNPAEDKALRAIAGSIKTLDVRADVRADFHEDICAAPALADGSFDAVVAHHVFAHVHDDGKAFAEVARILRPDGRLFLTTPLTPSGKTEQITEIAEITRLWGQELYDRYRIGTFRRYGKDDLLRKLTEWFRVVVHYGTDASTSEIVPILECIVREQHNTAATR